MELSPTVSDQKTPLTPTRVQFGEFTMNLRTGDLTRGETPVKLQPQPLEVLRLLVQSTGQTVPRRKLIREIWGENHYGDHQRGLNHCVKEIRKALGDDATRPRYVQTIPRRGYRFVAEVTSKALPPERNWLRSANRMLWRTAAAALVASGVALGAYFFSTAPPANATPKVVLSPLEVGADLDDVECPRHFNRFVGKHLTSAVGDRAVILQSAELGDLTQEDPALVFAGTFEKIDNQYKMKLTLAGETGVPLWSGIYFVPLDRLPEAGMAAAQSATDELHATLDAIAASPELQAHAGLLRKRQPGVALAQAGATLDLPESHLLYRN